MTRLITLPREIVLLIENNKTLLSLLQLRLESALGAAR